MVKDPSPESQCQGCPRHTSLRRSASGSHSLVSGRPEETAFNCLSPEWCVFGPSGSLPRSSQPAALSGLLWHNIRMNCPSRSPAKRWWVQTKSCPGKAVLPASYAQTLTACLWGCSGSILSRKCLACTTAPPEYDTVPGTIGHTINYWMKACTYFQPCTRSYLWPPQTLLSFRTLFQTWGPLQRKKGLFLLPSFPFISLSLCCDLCQHQKHFFPLKIDLGLESWSSSQFGGTKAVP